MRKPEAFQEDLLWKSLVLQLLQSEAKVLEVPAAARTLTIFSAQALKSGGAHPIHVARRRAICSLASLPLCKHEATSAPAIPAR